MSLDVEAIHQDAAIKLAEEEYKKAVAEHLEVLRARKHHMFPKRIVFQWPIRLEDWYKSNKTVKTYNSCI